MRPRSIQSAFGADSHANSFERLEEFAGTIVRVPKEEAEKEIKKASSAIQKQRGKTKPNRKS